jgi:hypothetical protein
MQLFDYLSFKAENPTLIPHKRDESDVFAHQIVVWLKEENTLANYLRNRVILSDGDIALYKKKFMFLRASHIFPGLALKKKRPLQILKHWKSM